MPAALPPEERKRRQQERLRKWKAANREHIKAYKRLNYARNSERIIARQRELMTPEQKERRKLNWQEWYKRPENKRAVIQRGRTWAKTNPERYREQQLGSQRKRYLEREDLRSRYIRPGPARDRHLAYQREYGTTPKAKVSRQKWYKNNRSKVTAYVRVRRQTDISFRLLGSLRRRVWEALRGKNKSARTMELIGCSIEALMLHLSSQFLPGMSWDNYGRDGWHVDHIRACSKFDLSNPEEQRACFHFSNLQPLWAGDNMSKGDRDDWKPKKRPSQLASI